MLISSRVPLLYILFLVDIILVHILNVKDGWAELKDIFSVSSSLVGLKFYEFN